MADPGASHLHCGCVFPRVLVLSLVPSVAQLGLALVLLKLRESGEVEGCSPTTWAWQPSHHTLELTWALLGSGIVPLHWAASCTVSWCEVGRSQGCPCSLSAHQRTALRSEAALKSLGSRRSSFSGPHAGQVWFNSAAEKHAPRWVRQAGPHGDVQSRAPGGLPTEYGIKFQYHHY